MCSLTFALAIMAAVFLYGPRPVLQSLQTMEISIHHFLHMRQTDFIVGNIEFYLPGFVAALCIWGFLRLWSGTSLVRWILRSAAGIAALALAPTWWLCLMYSYVEAAARRYPLQTGQFYELILVLVCAFLYLGGRWLVPGWVGPLVVLAHGGFWIWQFRPYNYWAFFLKWEVSPFMGLCASLIWLLYVRHLGDSARPIQRVPTSEG